MSSSPRRALLVALVAVAWVSAGAAPLRDALGGALAPVDFVRDYVAAHARVHVGRGAAPADEAGNAYAAALGGPTVVLFEGPFHLHPPAALLPVLPLVPLGFAGAALAWLVLSLAALGALAFMLVEILDEARAPTATRVLTAFLLALAWPPVLHNLAKGQWSILLAALMAAGARALTLGRPRAAGVWLGLAASFKATPVLLLAFLVLRHRRAAAAMLTTLVALAAVTLAVNGLAPWRAWLADAPRDVVAWQGWVANTASLNGLPARLFAGGRFARPLLEAPALARALTIGLSGALVLGLAFVTWRAERSPANERGLFAAWALLSVVLNPLAWSHTLVMALVPAALLVGLVPLWALGVALALLSIPRESLAALAIPVPVAPLRGLVLSLHAAALLFLVALVAWEMQRPRRRRGPQVY
jgi:Glycosyltransferase family 87